MKEAFADYLDNLYLSSVRMSRQDESYLREVAKSREAS